MTIPAVAMSAPPSYPQSTSRNTATRSAPVPHFDSILRAAPAFDAEVDLTDIGNESASSSTLSLPQQRESIEDKPWKVSLRPYLEQHASLHAYLDANTRLEQLLHHTQENIHIDAGKIKTTSTKTMRLEKKLQELLLEGNKKKKLFWSPKRRKHWRHQVTETQAELEPNKKVLHEAEQALLLDRQKLGDLQSELIDYKKVEARLDSIDDEVFGGITADHPEEDELEQKYHISSQTERRLKASIQVEVRCQNHLKKAYALCLALIKELLVGLNIGIDIGVPTNQKHKTGLWRGSSPTHSANKSRSHILRAKTICGDLHTNYIMARAVQRRIAVLTNLKVIELNRLPGMNAKNVLNEAELHRSLEQSYAQAKIAKAHIEGQQRHSKDRQDQLKKHIKELQKEARMYWLQMRERRRNIVEAFRIECRLNGEVPNNALTLGAGDDLPPYKRNLISASVVGLSASQEKAQMIHLPDAFRRRVDRESIHRSRAIIVQIAVLVGGVLEDDNIEDHDGTSGEEDLPGLELSFRS